MDINLLALNLGNSRLAIGAFASGELRNVARVPSSEVGQWREAIAKAWETLGGADRPAVVAAGVNPALAAKLEEIAGEVTGYDVQWVGKEIETPINVLTEPPQQTGIDRVLNIAAAYEQMEKACCVVDAGTAVTVDFCNDNGDFLGGAIAPGTAMMLAALHSGTAQLPELKFAAPAGTIGKSTPQAILHGVYHSIRGLVREIVENHATEAGAWPEIIATGGDARLLFEDWELIHAVSPDLTLYGIALAYANHHIRRGS